MQKLLATGVVWLLFIGTLLAQGTTRVSGTIRTETGEPLPGANNAARCRPDQNPPRGQF